MTTARRQRFSADVTTDHGHDLGEHNQLGKQYPHYDSHANIPLLVWHPEHPGNGQGVCCTDGEWTLFKSPLPGKPLYSYSAQLFQTLEAFYYEWLKLLDRSVSSVATPAEQGYFI